MLFHSDNTRDVWQTFCVEAGHGSSEDITLGVTYEVMSTDLHIASDTGDYVTDAAKWLYYQSLHNSSALAGYVPGNIVSDSYLQEAIWHGVPKSNNPPLDTPFAGVAVTWFNAAAFATAGGSWANANQVRGLNPARSTCKGTQPGQSQLYEVSSTTSVPEPSTFVLSVVAVIGRLVLRIGRIRRLKP